MNSIVTANPDTIARAAETIRAGGLVAFPTETVYGLGADATNGKAVAKLYEAKGRPHFNPLISHVSNLEQARRLAVFNKDAETLAHYFWPGPLTLILPRAENCPVSELACAGLPTIALRMPDHPAALALIENAGVPLAAPSANRSGSLSPTTPAHVDASLGEKVDTILAGGGCKIGLESSVVDLSEDTPKILRPGAITPEDIRQVLERAINYSDKKTDSPKSPGLLLKHYAPDTPVRMNAIDLKPGEALLAFGSDKFMGMEGGGSAADLPDNARRNLSEKQDLHEAAANLFRMLHDLDRPEHTAIAVMPIPEEGLGAAINDRLRRAAS